MQRVLKREKIIAHMEAHAEFQIWGNSRGFHYGGFFLLYYFFILITKS